MKITPKDNLAALIFDIEIQLNQMRIEKKKTEFYLTFQVLKDFNDEYFDSYKEHYITQKRIIEYSNILRSM